MIGVGFEQISNVAAYASIGSYCKNPAAAYASIGSNKSNKSTKSHTSNKSYGSNKSHKSHKSYGSNHSLKKYRLPRIHEVSSETGLKEDIDRKEYLYKSKIKDLQKRIADMKRITALTKVDIDKTKEKLK